MTERKPEPQWKIERIIHWYTATELENKVIYRGKKIVNGAEVIVEEWMNDCAFARCFTRYGLRRLPSGDYCEKHYLESPCCTFPGCAEPAVNYKTNTEHRCGRHWMGKEDNAESARLLARSRSALANYDQMKPPLCSIFSRDFVQGVRKYMKEHGLNLDINEVTDAHKRLSKAKKIAGIMAARKTNKRIEELRGEHENAE
ncbi:MAG: hypothetical protein GY832_47285 [Chloroflexi bacterium]|nr:hypothetical protein [Chloroflexota bacterium]